MAINLPPQTSEVALCSMQLLPQLLSFARLVKTDFGSYRGSGPLATQNRLFSGGVDSAEVLNSTQLLTFGRDVCNAPV